MKFELVGEISQRPIVTAEFVDGKWMFSYPEASEESMLIEQSMFRDQLEFDLKFGVIPVGAQFREQIRWNVNDPDAYLNYLKNTHGELLKITA